MSIFILIALPVLIIILILSQKTNSSIQGDGLKIPLSPFAKRLQQTIIVSILIFLATSIYYSQEFQKNLVLPQQPSPVQQEVPTQKTNLNKGFLDFTKNQ